MPLFKAPAGSHGKQQTTISSFFTSNQAASSASSTKSKASAPSALQKAPVDDAGPVETSTDVEEASKDALLRSLDGIPQERLRKRGTRKIVPQSKKRDLDLSDHENGEQMCGTGTIDATKRRKRLRGSASDLQPIGEVDSEVDKKNEPDTEMEDTCSELSKATSNCRIVSVAKTLKELTQEKTSRFMYTPSQKPQAADVDTERTKRLANLHQKFTQKLKGPSLVEGDKRVAAGEDFEGYEYVEGVGEEIEEERSTSKGSKMEILQTKAAKKAKTKFTPLEKQVVEIKMKYPDTILVVEVGYKFRFFGEDARVASKELSIMCIPGKMRFDDHPSETHLDKFASASIPVHRLHVHVKRLVAAGHKVGVVRQLETAALKAVGDNRNAPFTRKLTNLYTKGTYVDDVEGFDDVSGIGSNAPTTGHLLCLTERLAGGMGADEKVNVGIIAVQPSTGDIIYDEFEDGFMRSEIETRLLHIAPCELLIVGELSKATEKLITHLAGSTSSVFGDKIRVEKVNKIIMATAAGHVSKFYADKAKETGISELLDSVLNFPDLITQCLSAMITHMETYGLENVFDLTKYFQSFSTTSHMLLNGNTLSSLEIYQNQSDYTDKGSLFWVLDRTKTKFGRRMLRKWVGRPLVDKQQLEERIAAVEEMMAGENLKLSRLRELLARTSCDLEKGLIRIYYGKCSRPELLSVLQTMNRIANSFPKVGHPSEPGFRSRLINEAIAALPGVLDHVTKYLDVFNHQAAGKDDKYNFFKNEEQSYEAINEKKLGIIAVEQDLQDHLPDIAKQLKKKKVIYVTVSQIEYLVEVENTKDMLKNVPPSWIKISGTKKVSRFHTPRVIKLIAERDQFKESLASECDIAFREFLAEISTNYQALRDCVQSLATLDCLLSLATVASQPNYVKPQYTDEVCIQVTEGRHPMVEQLLIDTYVPNDINLRSNGRRAMLVTGPNMGGKSSFVRQVALIAIMGQIGSYVPAKYAKLGILDAVFTRMGAHDNMLAGESTFMVELSETSDILKQATSRSLVILDELGRGTSTHDGVAIAHAVLDHVVTTLKSMCLFVTHYPLLAHFGEKYPDHVVNSHMRFQEATDGSENITFLYQMGEGVAHRSYGLNVARLAGLPKQCLETATVKSKHLEEELKERESLRLATVLKSVLSDLGDPEVLLDSVDSLEAPL